MLPIEALAAWAKICDNTDIKWYLYKETLLCANGYDEFPEELPYAQIAVRAKDLADIMTYIFPALPKDWKFAENDFVSGKKMICFKQGGSIVLTIDVLMAIDEAEKMEKLDKISKKIRSKGRRKIKRCNMGIKFLGRRLGKGFVNGKKKTTNRTCAALVALTERREEKIELFCDILTNKEGMLLPKNWFKDSELLQCGGLSYPVFAGYRAYLEEMYGDFEQGLGDAVGVGLTVEEKKELQAHQARCKEALSFLQALSQEFDLRYYLIAGSVLGPIRHGGFIPWDDDVDVGIRVEELERFEAVVKEELPKRLPEGFTLEQSAANHSYPRMFSKICFEGRCCVDLWPLVPTYMEGFRAKLLWYFGKIITKVHYLKIGHKVGKFRRIAKLMGLFMTDKMVMKAARRNERKYVGKDVPAYVNLYSIYRREKETFKREWLDEPATALFDGLEVPVVGHTKLYLTHLYGNYMGRPAPWKRVSRHVARFGAQQEEE